VSDNSDKPFEPTPQRMEKARREGDVARSGEFAANLSFACAAATVMAAAPLLSANARAAIVAATAGRIPFAPSAMAFAPAFMALAAAVAAALGAALLQNGARLVPVTFKAERLNPVAGFKRTVSRETAGRTVRAVAAFSLASVAMASALATAAAQMLRSAQWTAIATAAWQAAERCCFAACAVGVLFAAAEYGAARRAWLQKLRMTFEERRRESKEQDGDPMARGRRRTLHRALLRGALSDVKNASFVVANPTHVAVALQYRPPEIDVPRVTVRAADEAARRVRLLAAQHGVPIVENVTLARSLYRDGRIGEPIAHEQYVAVAEIVISLSRNRP
jgi:flagellar biosynthesis protein FlhB